MKMTQEYFQTLYDWCKNANKVDGEFIVLDKPFSTTYQTPGLVDCKSIWIDRISWGKNSNQLILSGEGYRWGQPEKMKMNISESLLIYPDMDTTSIISQILMEMVDKANEN